MSLGTALPHDSALLHVTGQARYVDDTPLPAGCLHLAFGLSSVAHGVITGMDLAAVRAAPGVVAVLTAGDLRRPADTSPAWHDEPLLADGTVHFVGQPVFLVIADSHRAALRAARLGVITYEERPAVLTLDDALAAGSHFEGGPVIWSRGDAAAALARAAHVLDATMDIGGQEHFYLEGQAAAAIPGEGGDMHILSSTQHPSEIQEKVAEALGLPMHSVRVECRRMGGGFGGKESQGNAPAIACAVAAEITGRPCRMRYDRDDDFVITGKRHDFRIRYRVGFDDAGRILGLEMTHLVRCGWSRDLSTPVADRAMLHTDNAYHLPHVRIESHRLRTNTQSNTAFRGFGGPQGVLAIERVMDHIAHARGLDPLAVRRANLYAAGQTTHYGQPVTHFALPRLIDRLTGTADYDARRQAVADWNAAHPILKRGLALTPVKFGISFTLTHMNQAGALVHVYHDGSIHLNHGGTEMGQGLFQKVAQVAAAEFGVPLGAVKITATDTAKVPNTAPTAASSGSDLNGMAVQAACVAIKARMAKHLAGLHQADPATVRFEAGRVMVGAAEMTFAAAATRCWKDRVGLSATGHYKTPDISWDRARGQGRPFLYFAHGAAVAEVVIDTLTGEYRILRADILHDCGASLNPAIDIGQIEGGFVQGAGWLTTEELVWDDRGRLRTHAPATYKIPACSDRPRVFNVALWDEPNPAPTIGRSKAVGEPPLMLANAVFLALSDAVASCGAAYPALDAPATPERVLMAVRRVQAG